MSKKQAVDFNAPYIQRHNYWRRIKDKVATVGIGIGGVSVIGAILLIFLYLLHEVMPLFEPATVNKLSQYSVLGANTHSSDVLHLAVEEQNEVAVKVLRQGRLEFFSLATGQNIKTVTLPLSGLAISQFAFDDASELMAFGLSDGSVLLAKYRYKISYPNNKRLITPVLEYPYGETPLAFSSTAFTSLALRDQEQALWVLAGHENRVQILQLNKTESFLTGEIELEKSIKTLPALEFSPNKLFVDVSLRFAYLLGQNKTFAYYDFNEQRLQYLQLEHTIVDSKMLLGGISLLLADSSGAVSQWFPVAENNNLILKRIRQFHANSESPQLMIASENRRKGFLTVRSDGSLQIFHSTAHERVFEQKLFEKPITNMAVSPRANRLLALNDSGEMSVFAIDNEHPEVSWSSLWNKIWYESYPEPSYTWQSSASSNDFEPKLSLTPLAFGTLKAAFYAMLLGAPLAICGAIYTAYFMNSKMRRKVKPLIELMEALPTVILGFLAGLWLAPFLEKNLVGVFSILLVLPPSVLLLSFMASKLPMPWQNVLNEGWHSVLLIPAIILVAYVCLAISPALEQWFFAGNMRGWLTHSLGVSFDQRNAMVVGIAMGFAVIPTIFSIAEDAIFSVPKHLSYGSLALGATPWQTLKNVVLPTASPGIFSALMIGLGRAVGETMIVLMATGNTPIMDANIFEGMRTLSANLAVEIPEAEVASSHYRVLFLAAFVLFLFTFVVNTVAEVVRQRLRKKYGSL